MSIPRRNNTLFDIHGERVWDNLIDGAVIVLFCFALLAVYGWVGAMDAAAAAEDRLTHCLNGGTFQVNTNDALKCQGVLYEKGN